MCYSTGGLRERNSLRGGSCHIRLCRRRGDYGLSHLPRHRGSKFNEEKIPVYIDSALDYIEEYVIYLEQLDGLLKPNYDTFSDTLIHLTYASAKSFVETELHEKDNKTKVLEYFHAFACSETIKILSNRMKNKRFPKIKRAIIDVFLFFKEIVITVIKFIPKFLLLIMCLFFIGGIAFLLATNTDFGRHNKDLIIDITAILCLLSALYFHHKTND